MSMDLVMKTKRYDEAGKLIKFSFDVGYMDTKFLANVHRASACKEYGFVLQASVVSPDTHRILQAGGKRYNDFIKKLDKKLVEAKLTAENALPGTPELGKAEKTVALLEGKKEKLRLGKPLEELNAVGEIYLKSGDEKNIKKELEGLVMRLYGDYQDDIFKALRRAVSTSDLHARTAFDMYQNDFFAFLPATTSKVLHGKKNNLKHLCNSLNAMPISALRESDLNRAFSELKGDATAKMKLAEKFFDYVGENGGYVGINPVTKFWGQKLVKSKKGAATKIYKRQSTHLSPKSEKYLHNYLSQHILEDDLALGIALAKGFNMDIDRILTITWQDIEIEGNEVRIRENKPNYTGGTHNYTRPPARETADLLIERYQHLCLDHGKTNLKKRLVVPVPGSKKEKKAAFTAYFRRILTSAAVAQEDFAIAMNPQDTKAAGGAGYALLCKHYAYTLREKCGIHPESGLGCYLMGMRIYDTTTDYYWCLSDETGNHHLQTIMRRADVGDSAVQMEKPPITEMETDTANRTFVVLPTGQGHLNAVSTKRQLLIPAGSTVVIRSQYGVKGLAKFSSIPKSTVSADYQELY